MAPCDQLIWSVYDKHLLIGITIETYTGGLDEYQNYDFHKSRGHFDDVCIFRDQHRIPTIAAQICLLYNYKKEYDKVLVHSLLFLTKKLTLALKESIPNTSISLYRFMLQIKVCTFIGWCSYNFNAILFALPVAHWEIWWVILKRTFIEHHPRLGRW